MAQNRYTVVTIYDDPEHLQRELNQIGREGGRVINVVWTPARTTKVPLKGGEWESGYTIIAEFNDAPRPQR